MTGGGWRGPGGGGDEFLPPPPVPLLSLGHLLLGTSILKPLSSPVAFRLYEPRPTLGPGPGQVGTLTPGHLDELGDAEHTRGDKALLEVSRVWNEERMGVSGSVVPPRHPGAAQTRGVGPSLGSDLVYTLQPCSRGLATTPSGPLRESLHPHTAGAESLASSPSLPSLGLGGPHI